MSDETTITKRLVASMLGVTTRQVERYEAQDEDPLPIAERAPKGSKRGHRYNVHDVFRWGLRQHSGETLDYQRERARLTHHQANKTQLEEEVLRGSLIPADRVESVWSAMVAAFRARCIGIPTKAAPMVLGAGDVNEAERILRDLVYEALAELQDYEPGHYQDSGKAGGKSGEPAAESDGERVGGRAPSAEPRGQRRAGAVGNGKG